MAGQRRGMAGQPPGQPPGRPGGPAGQCHLYGE